MQNSTPSKQCNECGEVKPLDSFYKNARGGQGRMPKCSPCYLIVQASNRYGITKAFYAELLQRPCQICGGAGEVIDHCHASGLVRGRLCKPCNMAIGGLRDSPDLCRKAADYLEDYDKTNHKPA